MRQTIILACVLITSLVFAEDVVVQTKNGPVRGTILVSPRNNTSFYAFMGMPYAKPPVGPLRFKAPQKVESWTEVRKATKEGSVCPQIKSWTEDEYVGDEDCLFLNVYTPKLQGGVPKPVMVWIHGGAFIRESGNMEYAGPHYLVEGGLVFVSINYRLGPLGFLNLDNEEVPGNAGMKDQVLALKWVQENIALFGGNPEKVTIVGESAGAKSVEFHKLSPMSKGLFYQAISESGTALGFWQYMSNRLEANSTVAFEFGELLGVNTTNKDTLLENLRKFTPKQLVQASEKLSAKGSEVGIRPAFIPVLDIHSSSGDVFLPDTPQNLLISGMFTSVPSIIGINSAEGMLFLAAVKNFINKIEKYIDLDLNGEFKAEVTTSTYLEIIGKIKNFYFKNTTDTKSILEEYVDFTTDLSFLNGALCTTTLQISHSKNPVYFYLFDFSGEMNIYKKRFGGWDLPGAAHVDEQMYIFSRLPDNFTQGTPELLTSQRMVKMWADFAKTGNPTPEKIPLLQNITWPPFSKSKQEYLQIQSSLSVQQYIKKSNMDLWTELYHNYSSHSFCWDNSAGTFTNPVLLVIFVLLLHILLEICQFDSKPN